MKCKRVFDIGISLLAIVVLLPVFVIIIAVIKLSSGGLAIFRQERAGKNGKPFMFYKFRTMKSGVDPFGPSSKTGDDPRLTGVGKFLRGHSLDELPQLFNVSKGDMSVIEPRPLCVSQIAEWGDCCNYRQLPQVQHNDRLLAAIIEQ